MDEELPGYSRRESRTSQTSANGSEYTSFLESLKGHKFLKMSVKSRSVNPNSLPLFLERDIISGRVELDLEKSETVKGVTISVKGVTTWVGQGELFFVDINDDLWTPAMGVPNNSEGPMYFSPTKLKGRYSWSFNITLPSETTISTQSYHLPPSFSETGSPAYIDYRLVVTMKRGPLKVNARLVTAFGYMPITRAETPSPLRQLAYRENSPIIGPEGDPEGWVVKPPVKATGTLFGTRKVEVDLCLAISNPLTFVLGSSLPLVMRIVSKDQQALDLFACTASIRVHLVRSLALGSDAINENLTRRSNNYFRESVARAVFWQSLEGAPVYGERILQGELVIKRNLKPSFLFPRFSYTLDLLPVEAAGFVPSMPAEQVLSSTKVTIVTANTPGVVPRSNALPGYRELPSGDYNNLVGLLSN